MKIKRQEVCTKCTKGNYYMFFKCDQCQSNRVYTKDIDYEVDIPQSAMDGHKIIIVGESHRSISASPGDLYIFVKVKEHFLFKRESQFNLTTNLEMDVFETISRKKIIVTGIDGQQYAIRKHKYQTFMPNTRIKIKDAGLFDPITMKRGHMNVIVDIINYEKMTPKQKIGER